MGVQLDDSLGPIPRLTRTERANLRDNLRRLARDEDDAALLIEMLEDDRG